MGKLFKAVAFVTIFSVLTRALGFLLRIYLSRVLGAELLGSYQVAMSIFGVFLTLVASGLPTIISRSVANLRAKGDSANQFKLVTAGLIVAVTISVVVCFIVFICPSILNMIFTSSSSTSVLLLLLPGVVASSVYTILRGALWGQKKFFSISFAEFFEQIVRLIILFILVSLPLNIGLGERAALSLSLACIVSALFVIILYFAFGGKLANPKGSFVPLLKTSTPITAVRTVSGIVSSAISIIIPARLMLYGYTSSEALAQFGIIMGMTFPLLMIPSTLISSLAVAIIPEISEQTTNIDIEVKNTEKLKTQINLSISLSVIISCVLLPAYIVLGKDIGIFLFSNETAGHYLTISAFLMIPMGISQITSSILNAIGLEIKSLINYAISALFLFICIYFLPKYLGVYALIIGMGGLSIITSILNLSMLHKRKLLNLKLIKIALIMIGMCIPTTLLGYLTYSLIAKILPLFFALTLGAIICIGTLILLLLCTNLANIRGFVFKNKFKKKTQLN